MPSDLVSGLVEDFFILGIIGVFFFKSLWIETIPKTFSPAIQRNYVNTECKDKLFPIYIFSIY